MEHLSAIDNASNIISNIKFSELGPLGASFLNLRPTSELLRDLSPSERQVLTLRHSVPVFELPPFDAEQYYQLIDTFNETVNLPDVPKRLSQLRQEQQLLTSEIETLQSHLDNLIAKNQMHNDIDNNTPEESAVKDILDELNSDIASLERRLRNQGVAEFN